MLHLLLSLLTGYGPFITMRTTSLQTRPPIEKFKGENFQQWKFKVTLLLTEEGVEDFAIGPVPQVPQQPADVLLHRAKAAKAQSIVCLCLDESLIPLVSACQTAHATWTLLLEQFQPTAMATELSLRNSSTLSTWMKVPTSPNISMLSPASCNRWPPSTRLFQTMKPQQSSSTVYPIPGRLWSR